MSLQEDRAYLIKARRGLIRYGLLTAGATALVVLGLCNEMPYTAFVFTWPALWWLGMTSICYSDIRHLRR